MRMLDKALRTSRAFATGYYAGHDNRGTLVHVHEVGKGPICGSRVAGSFQWCSHGVKREWIECRRCIRHISSHG